MRVFDDAVGGGGWFVCGDCNRYGDMIELAAATWELSIPAAVAKLQRGGLALPDDADSIGAYLRQHVQYRVRLTAMWDQAREQIAAPNRKGERLLSTLRLHCRAPQERWADGPGHLIGSLETDQVERAFAPGSMSHADGRNRKANPSANRTFRGKDWRDLLVLPFWDLPGRLCSVLAIGREANSNKDFVIKRIATGPRGYVHGHSDVELGLALHPCVPKVAADDWNGRVIATNDPITALRMQFKNFDSSRNPLPLVVWYDTLIRPAQRLDRRRARTIHAWQMLDGREIVFWMPGSFCVATLRQAIELNADISLVGPSSDVAEDLQEYVWKYSPRDLATHILKHARPWQETLTRYCEKLGDSELEDLLLKLQIDGADIGTVLRRCGPRLRERAQRLLERTPAAHSMVIDGRTIIQQDDQWLFAGRRGGRSELIVNATMRLDYVAKHRRSGTFYCSGIVRYRGETFPFCES